MLNFKIKAFEYDIQNSINADEIEHKIEVVKILKFILEDKYARKV